MQECEKSLKRLKTDRIDLYQLHWMHMATPLEESMRTLDDLVTQGKIPYTGCSKFAPVWLLEALFICERNGWVKFISEQPPYSLLDRTIDHELIWTCMRHGVGIIPWALGFSEANRPRTVHRPLVVDSKIGIRALRQKPSIAPMH